MALPLPPLSLSLADQTSQTAGAPVSVGYGGTNVYTLSSGNARSLLGPVIAVIAAVFLLKYIKKG